MRNRTLSAASLRLLTYILANTGQSGQPSFRDLRRACPGRTDSICRRLLQLKNAGLIEWQTGKQRTLRATCRMLVFREKFQNQEAIHV